jgi:hypothetical protein
MKKIYVVLVVVLLSLSLCSAQTTGFTENFNDNIKTGWSGDVALYPY